jgi:hypothetical protein
MVRKYDKEIKKQILHPVMLNCIKCIIHPGSGLQGGG